MAPAPGDGFAERPASDARPLVSVIVPTRDRPELLCRALRSIRAIPALGAEAEIIVADNSAGGTAREVAAAFGARWVAAPAPGAGAARNAGLRAARGRYLAFLDDDDEWTAEHLRPQLALLEAEPRLAAAVGRALPTDMALAPLLAAWPHALPRDGRVLGAWLAQYPQVGATVVRAEVARAVGPFDERLQGDEDWDWHLRLARGRRVGFVPVTSVLFRQRPPGRDSDLEWLRLWYFHRVFWRNVWRLRGRAGRSPAALARLYVAHLGVYHARFLAHAASGGGRRDRLRAVVASPPHAAAALGRAVLAGRGRGV